MAEIRLYGKLRSYAKDCPDSIIRVTPESEETLETLLNRLGIWLDDIYSIFRKHEVFLISFSCFCLHC